MSVRASVVIPAYNAQETIGLTLAALRGQIGAPPFETIVVDNASRDATAQIARDAGAVVLHESKRGPAAARNRGLHDARGEIVLCCDADTVPSRRWVCEMLHVFDDPQAILAAGNTLCYPPTTAAERFVIRTGLFDMERALSRPVLPFVITLNLGVRRAAALAVGGFSEDLESAEDVDFSQRLLAAFETHIVYRERALLYHRCRTNARALARQAYQYGEGMANCYQRFPGAVQWNLAKSALVLGRLAARRAEALVYGLRALAGAVPAEELEYYRYRNLWDTRFFTGFFVRYYGMRRS
jgi:glycosyltransferase involved in cell wall biosynthesis